jgi:hypothetical protein
METAHLIFLRPTYGVTLRDETKFRSEDIHIKFGEENIIEEIKYCQSKWKKHVSRTPPYRFPQQVFYRPIGRQKLGHQRKRWNDKC